MLQVEFSPPRDRRTMIWARGGFLSSPVASGAFHSRRSPHETFPEIVKLAEFRKQEIVSEESTRGDGVRCPLKSPPFSIASHRGSFLLLGVASRSSAGYAAGLARHRRPARLRGWETLDCVRAEQQELEPDFAGHSQACTPLRIAVSASSSRASRPLDKPRGRGSPRSNKVISLPSGL